MFKSSFLLGGLTFIFCVALAAEAIQAQSPVTVRAQRVLVQAFTGPAMGGLNDSSAVVDSTVIDAGGSSTWNAADNYLADGSVGLSDGNTCATLDLGDVINQAKGTEEGLFELRVTIEQPTRPVGNTQQTWYSIGFSQLDAPDTSQHWINRQGLATVMYHERGEFDLWAGNGFTPNGQNPSGAANPHTAADPPIDSDITNEVSGTRTLIVQVDVRDWNGVSDFGTVTFFDSDIVGSIFSFNYTNDPIPNNQGGENIPTDPDFASIMISEANGTTGTYSNLTLTQSVFVGLGDFNDDNAVDCEDIDLFRGRLGTPATATLPDFDLMADGMIDFADVEFLVENLVVTSNGQVGTFLGDFNCDGEVDVLNDAFILVGSLGSSVMSYSDGDANLDGTVDVLDDAFVLVGNLGMSNTPLPPAP